MDSKMVEDNSRRVAMGVVEAVVIALITGAASSVITVKMMERDVAALRESVARVERDLAEIRKDVYVPRTRITGGGQP